ncbi:hypothetical protein CVT24_010556 [Panaeolus cyanescens]|uniref:Nuclear rim protein 1 n=1 Tax=Panaeolus cyanescens TaxID=181874 RepID=A0A409YYJ1_9AGAR|nr:hypothetical protein CVT24_010556 [Panaeolus cyanescens]
MSLRRFAQENYASGSPRTPDPNSPSVATRRKPRISYGIHRSPADTPSVSSSIPFDWDAARSRAPPPYATPLKIRDLPSTIAFHIAIFPDNLPLPSSKICARAIAAALHVFNLCMHASYEAEYNWDDASSSRRSSWFDWTTPLALLLILFSLYNTYKVYSRRKTYKFHRRTEPLASPHAKFVVTDVDLEPLPQPSAAQRAWSAAVYAFSASWRFLLGFNPPARPSPPRIKTSRVQELEMWDPNELELELFTWYSPVHALIWFFMGYINWLLAIVLMFLISVQLNALVSMYTLLLKDRLILSAESMKEYNDIFVTPRLNPIRRDVAVMTHQSEIVNVWED